jgi:hypothetical protein
MPLYVTVSIGSTAAEATPLVSSEDPDVAGAALSKILRKAERANAPRARSRPREARS